VAYSDPNKAVPETFGNGERFNEAYYYMMKFPRKIEVRPSPLDYTLKSTFDVNKNKAPLIGSPSHIRVDGDHQAPFVDTLG
jgi:hypothetical protein